MVRITGRTLPWAILLGVIFGAVVLYFAAMLEVTGRISKERDDLERLSRKWLAIEVAVSEGVQPDSRIGNAVNLVRDFQRQLTSVLDLRWLSVLSKAYTQPRLRSEELRSAVSDLATRLGDNLILWPDFRTRAAGIEEDLEDLLGWIGVYSREQVRAFRVLLVFLAASMTFGAVLLFGFGNLIRLQEARFLAAIDSMSDALILTDASNTVIHANPAACRLFGANPDLLVGRALPETLRQGTMRTGWPRFSNDPIMEDSTDGGTEASLTDSTGRRRPVSLKVESVRDPSGKSRGSVYLIRDLTEWKRLVVSIASTFVNLQIEDADNAVIRALDQAASLCAAEISALPLFSGAEAEATLRPGESRDRPASDLPLRLELWVRKVASGGEPVFRNRESAEGEEAALFAGESLAWVAAIPLSFAGVVTGAIALASRSSGPAWGAREMAMPRILGSLVVELLAKKWAMREMNRLGFEYRDLIEHANVPIWGVDGERRVNEWNSAIATLTGHEKSIVLGSLAAGLIDSESGRAEFGGLLTRILAGERITDKELRIQIGDRGSTTLLVSGSPRLDSGGKVAGAIFIGQDISARVAAERRIKEQADALVEVQEIERLRIARDLHDNVAQDLSAARIVCETLFDGLEGDARQFRSRVAQLSEAITSSLQSIHDIAYELRPQNIERFGIVTSLAKLCESFGRTHGVKVAFQSAGVDGIHIESEHAANIYRIVQEALANAKRHASAHIVSVALVHSHPDLILRVTDDGVGFDVGQKCAEAADRKCMGLLGMQERASILGAALSITSRAGKGTQIKLTMPVDSMEKLDEPIEKHPSGR
jgi:PAS domain S-box-containing protein